MVTVRNFFVSLPEAGAKVGRRRQLNQAGEGQNLRHLQPQDPRPPAKEERRPRPGPKRRVSRLQRGHSVHGRAPNYANADCHPPKRGVPGEAPCPQPRSCRRTAEPALPTTVITQVPALPPVAEGYGPLPWLPAKRAEEETGGQAGGRRDQDE